MHILFLFILSASNLSHIFSNRHNTEQECNQYDGKCSYVFKTHMFTYIFLSYSSLLSTPLSLQYTDDTNHNPFSQDNPFSGTSFDITGYLRENDHGITRELLVTCLELMGGEWRSRRDQVHHLVVGGLHDGDTGKMKKIDRSRHMGEDTAIQTVLSAMNPLLCGGESTRKKLKFLKENEAALAKVSAIVRLAVLL